MNRLEERVGTLLEEGRDNLAADLLRAASHSRGIDEVTFVSDDRVRVTSGPFSGIHDVKIEDADDVSIDPESHYQYSGAEIKTEFSVRSLTDSEHQAIRNAIQPDCETETPEDSPTPSAEPTSPPMVADGGQTESSLAGLRERLRNVFNYDDLVQTLRR